MTPFVLQHRERLDRLGRDVAQHGRGDLHAVQHQQRTRVRTEGRDTAHVEVGAVVTRLARALGGDHARDVAREARGEVTRSHHQLARLHRLHGAHQRLLLLGTETHHDHFVDLGLLLDHGHQSEQIGIAYRDLLGVVTDHFEYYGLGIRRHLDRVCSVHVRRDADRGILLHIDRNAYQRFVVARSDDETLQNTFFVLVLRICRRRFRRLGGPIFRFGSECRRSDQNARAQHQRRETPNRKAKHPFNGKIPHRLKVKE